MIKFSNLEDMILPSNSCPFDVQKGRRGGIRVIMHSDIFDVEIQNANEE
jgi:hypothetical protein